MRQNPNRERRDLRQALVVRGASRRWRKGSSVGAEAVEG